MTRIFEWIDDLEKSCAAATTISTETLLKEELEAEEEKAAKEVKELKKIEKEESEEE